MAKARSKPVGSKGISATKLYVFGVICFFISRLFANKIAAVDYGFAIVGFALFAFALVTFFKQRKRR